MLALLTVLPLLSFILIDTHVKGRLFTKGFFLKLAYTTNYVVLTLLTLRFLKLISLLYMLYILTISTLFTLGEAVTIYER